MNILGINAYHGDSSAALIRDGRLVAAVEEERFRRIKHWAGLPVLSMQYCLDEAGLRFEDLEHIAINLDPRVNNLRRLLFILRTRPSLRLLFERMRKRRQTRSVEQAIAAAFPGKPMRARIHHVEHHLAHLASSYLCSPFENAVNVSIDGMGDFASAAWGTGIDGHLDIEGRVYFPHSLGIFYSALTQWLGFPHYGDEYKVMGLAPYGEPRHLDLMRRIVLLQTDGSFRLNLDCFLHHRQSVSYSWDNGSPDVGTLYSSGLVDLLGPTRNKDEPLTQRHKDIARSVQAIYEEAFFHLLNTLHRRHGLDDLTISGGCGMNSVANGKVRRLTPFKRVYVQSAAGDAGGAIGAALVTAQRLAARLSLPKPARHHMDHAYWGPSYPESEILNLIHAENQRIEQAGCTIVRIPDDADLCALTAKAISEGLVIGWFQGRLEWGPRALGNRSILGDPRRADMKDILNQKIKRRESFRPFAPSVLREDVSEWFEEDDNVPFMMQVYQIRAEKRPLIPAVTHVDGSGRLQTVHAETNPLYHQLITAFKAFTGVPMILNTSFNENEPVVCHPREALDCFLRTRMDFLVLDRHVIRRTTANP